MKIRSMGEKDIRSVCKIGVAVKNFEVSPEFPSFWSNRQMKKWVKSKNDVLLVAEEGKRVIGFAIASLHIHTEKATFENLWVAPEFQGKGIATKLIKELIKNLKKKGGTYLCGMTKITNKPMLNLFKKEGFNKGYKFYWISKLL